MNSRKNQRYQQSLLVRNLQQIEIQMDNSDEFQPDSCGSQESQHYGQPKKQQRYVSGENNGKWSQLQNTKYIAYIEFHKDKMRSKEKRRVSKFYKEMSKFIGTRNALQCRSHHQKLEDRYLYPNKIIAYFKQHNNLTLYHRLKQELEDFENRTSVSTSSDLKLQDHNIDPVLKTKEAEPPITTASLPSNFVVPQPTEGNTRPYLIMNGMSAMTYPMAPNWGDCLYYPYYQIY